MMVHDLDPISPRSLELNYPDWRDKTGTPTVYLQKTVNTFWLVPKPNDGKELLVNVALKPTRTTTILTLLLVILIETESYTVLFTGY